MRAVVQRVKEAWVNVDQEERARIAKGLLVLLGIEKDDNHTDVSWLVKKLVGLRIFEDSDNRMNLSVRDVKGEFLVVSNFTICGDCRKGRRPSFDKAAPVEQAKGLYEDFCAELEQEEVPVKRGIFQARMEVGLINDGPVTILLDSRKRF